jgi:hypothetical protein
MYSHLVLTRFPAVLGWLGDALFAAEQGMYNFDLSAIYHSFLNSIEDNQGASGDVPFVVPGPEPGKSSCNDIAWTSAYPQLAALMYKYYGDVRVLEQHYTSYHTIFTILTIHHTHCRYWSSTTPPTTLYSPYSLFTIHTVGTGAAPLLLPPYIHHTHHSPYTL